MFVPEPTAALVPRGKKHGLGTLPTVSQRQKAVADAQVQEAAAEHERAVLERQREAASKRMQDGATPPPHASTPARSTGNDHIVR